MNKIEMVSILMILVFGPTLILAIWNDFISPIPYCNLYKLVAMIFGLIVVPVMLSWK